MEGAFRGRNNADLLKVLFNGVGRGFLGGGHYSNWSRTSTSSYLVKELPQGFVALPLVAHLGAGHTASARADVGRAVLLARVVEVAGLGCVQAVVLSGHCRLTYKGGMGEAGETQLTHSSMKLRYFKP